MTKQHFCSIYCNLRLAVLCFGALIGVTLQTQAQDIHYSQFYTDGIRQNPAATGNFNGRYRVGLNARNQWQSVPVPYRTASVYTDFSFAQRKLRNGTVDWLGLGVNLLYDNAGDSRLSMLEARLAAAAHKSLTSNLYASIGASATFKQRSLSYEQLFFSSQWNDVGFDPGIDSQENFDNQQFSYIDIHIGTSISYTLPQKFSLYANTSLLHVNRPQETFINSDNRLGLRYLTNIGGSIITNKLNIEPALFMSMQKGAREIIAGSNLVFAKRSNNRQKNDVNYYLGAWYRWQDAVIALTGISVSTYRILFSYDINTSALSAATQGRGGFEISFVHVGIDKRKPNTPVYCPRF